MQQNNSTDKTASAHKTDEIMVYEHPFFGKIRVFVRYGKIWFCGLDAASSLQYSNPLKALLEHCKPSSVMMREVGDDIMEFINERSMYRLIYKSPFPPMADEFERWIFDNIVPSATNTGSYYAQVRLPNFNNPAEAARAWADEYERNQALKPQPNESNEWYSIKRWAKENGVNWKKISRMKMKAISCKLGYQIKKIFDDNHCQVNTYNVNVFKAYFNKCE